MLFNYDGITIIKNSNKYTGNLVFKLWYGHWFSSSKLAIFCDD